MKDVLKDKDGNILNPHIPRYEEKVLFEGSTNQNVTLNDDVKNYKYIEIFYRQVNEFYNSVKVFSPNNKKVGLVVPVTHNGNTLFSIHARIVTISGKIISDYIDDGGKKYYGALTQWGTNPTQYEEQNYIYITRVIGYK